MKTSIAASIVLTSALASQVFARVSALQQPLDLSDSLAKALIKDLINQDIQSDSLVWGLDRWSFEAVTCEYTYFEVLTPKGGPVKERNSCVLESKDGVPVKLSAENAAAFIDNLDLLGVPYEGVPGLPFRSYSLKKLDCKKTVMELVAPGGGGFNIREYFACSIEI